MTTVHKTFTLTEAKLDVYTKIASAKTRNEKSLNWKPLLPIMASDLDELYNCLIDQNYEIDFFDNAETILIKWD